MVFSYYPGCTLSTTAERLDRYARASAQVLGFSLVELDEWQCCGAVFPLGTDEIAPKLAAVRALNQAKQKGRALVTLCSACHHVLKRVNHQARNDKDLQRILKNYDEELDYAGETEVLHYMEVLKQYIGFDVLKEKVVEPLKGRKIGAYYGCMLLRPREVMEFDDPESPVIFEDLIRALGAEAVSYPCKNECCGGYRALQDKGKVRELTGKVTSSASARGAEMLITACPLCQYNMKDEDLPVYYFTELLAEALGVKGGEACE